MVYTVTLNPALDYVMRVDKLRADDINRSYFEELHYGGKGINVSVMLTRLGIPNKALGFIAGFTGDALADMVKAEGVNCAFLRLKKGNTRINVKIRSGNELDINAHGPQIGNGDTDDLISLLSDINRGDYLVLAGSVPENMPDDIYHRIICAVEGKGINLVADTTGELLLSTLKHKPFLIKPNHHELGDLFGVKTETAEEIIEYAARLQKKGARNVLVSRGDKGALLLDESGGITSIGAVKGEVVNTVGAGDSMLAGFLAGYIEKGDYKYALRLAAACGNATAFCESLAGVSDVKRIFEKV